MINYLIMLKANGLELTDEYMELTGGTGTLFPEGFTGEKATENQEQEQAEDQSGRLG